MNSASGDKADQGRLLADAATSFVGKPFRLHGRNPVLGLDCIGLVHASLLTLGRIPKVPEGYRLRNADPARWFEFADQSGFVRASHGVIRGDIVLIEPGPGQQHLVIADSSTAAIHAHAGLRRVVRQPMAFPASPLAHWRLT